MCRDYLLSGIGVNCGMDQNNAAPYFLPRPVELSGGVYNRIIRIYYILIQKVKLHCRVSTTQLKSLARNESI